MNQLEPCPHCHRHVIVSETSCPFCAGPLAETFANLAPRVTPRVRLGRAATFAFGVLAMSQAACTEEGRSPSDAAKDSAMVPPDAAIDQGIPDDADDGGVAIYSAAPTTPTTPDGGTTSTSRG